MHSSAAPDGFSDILAHAVKANFNLIVLSNVHFRDALYLSLERK